MCAFIVHKDNLKSTIFFDSISWSSNNVYGVSLVAIRYGPFEWTGNIIGTCTEIYEVYYLFILFLKDEVFYYY